MHTTNITNHLNSAVKSKRSQSALEYMMTYGWAILIIVIVAVILYSMGIFNPSSSITFTSSGFSPFTVSSSLCNNLGYEIEILAGPIPNNANSITINKVFVTSATGANTTTASYTLTNPVTLKSGQSATILIPNVACNSANTHYSLSAKIQYSYTASTLGLQKVNTTGTIAGISSPVLVASFNGINSYISTAKSSILNTSKNFSLAIWFKTSDYGAMIWLGSGPMPNPVSAWWNILYVGNNNSLFGGTDCGPIFETSKIVSNNAWNFVVLTENITASGKTEVLYLNGSEIGKISISDSKCEISPTYFVIGAGDSNGANWPNLPPSSYFDGFISNVQVYNLPITSNNVSKLFLGGREGLPLQSDDIIAWWPLDGNTLDYSGKGNTGTAHNVNWVSP